MPGKSHFFYFIAICAIAFIVLSPSITHAATVSFGPSGGTFTVGSTFNVSILLDTKGASVNAIDLVVRFPSEKLQIVAPSLGQSIIGTWINQPTYDNRNGSARFQGGIPGGITVSQGVISTITFRVRQIGTAVISFAPDSKVLLNDGKGTDVLEKSGSAIYALALPPPAGPIVASPTHPDQTRWYANESVIFNWANEDSSEEYSYLLNALPTDVPDNIPDGTRTTVAYKSVEDGTSYFHIKSIRDGIWGNVTHFAVNVDTVPPASFPIEVLPSRWTTDKKITVRFSTTDAASGINHYEYAAVAMRPTLEARVADASNFFIEGTSPQVLALNPGAYDVIVRAYDNAGNMRESTVRVHIANSVFEFLLFPWALFAGAVLVSVLGYATYRMRRWGIDTSKKLSSRAMPESVSKMVVELKKYRKKYGKIMTVLLAAGSIFTGAMLAHSVAYAQETGLQPPIISTISRNISNEDIFYAGGTATVADTDISLYVQDVKSGTTMSYAVTANKKGEWFYRSAAFLPAGRYIVWAQAKKNGSESPPSAQMQMAVTPTAIQFGSSRLSYETLYLVFSVALFAIAIVLAVLLALYFTRGREKHYRLMKEIREAEEAARRGFAVLKRDLEAELAVIKKAKLRKELSAEEAQRERQLLEDLSRVEQQVGKEIWDIEVAENP